MYLLRLILVFIIIYLIIRAFIMAGSTKEPVKKKSDSSNIRANPSKGVPKSIGEYIDYEEVNKSK
jgi:hypothetical protein